jgi:multidrug efflux pump subunit AcrA (membrane-fusion protein)
MKFNLIFSAIKEFWSNKVWQHKRGKLVVILVVLALISGILIWRGIAKKNQTPQLQTATVEKGSLISTVTASGQVLSVNVISVNTKASGIVKAVYVKDGDLVRKGDRILEIELDLQGQQKYAQAWASYLSAKNSLESAKLSQYSLESAMWQAHETFKSRALDPDLAETDPVYIETNRDWLAAEGKYLNQAAVISQSQASLNSSWLSYIQNAPVITASTDGVITSLMFTEGMSIGSLDTGNTTSNQKVATIKKEGRPIVSVNLSEIDVSRVELGMKVTVTLDSIPDKTFTGEVIGVDRIGTTSSGVTQYPAIIRLDTSSEEMLPNMTGTAKILIAKKDGVLFVPSSAVERQQEQAFVRLLKGKEQQLVPVETGLENDTQTEIFSGLNEGDEVVVGSLGSTTQTTGNNGSPFGSSGARFMRLGR